SAPRRAAVQRTSGGAHGDITELAALGHESVQQNLAQRDAAARARTARSGLVPAQGGARSRAGATRLRANELGARLRRSVGLPPDAPLGDHSPPARDASGADPPDGAQLDGSQLDGAWLDGVRPDGAPLRGGHRRGAGAGAPEPSTAAHRFAPVRVRGRRARALRRFLGPRLGVADPPFGPRRRGEALAGAADDRRSLLASRRRGRSRRTPWRSLRERASELDRVRGVERASWFERAALVA